jgi:hypothetical protein
MSYWWPPLPAGFDPAPRPLRWKWVSLDALGIPALGGTTITSRVRWPEVEDQAYFGVGTSTDPLGEPTPAFDGSWLSAGTVKANIPKTFVPNVVNNPQSPLQRLLAYNALCELVAPGDPKDGGLQPDVIHEDGTVDRQYWDFSDPKRARRKFVRFTPKSSGGIGVSVYEWDPVKADWFGEGFDAERDFTNALPQILQGFSAGSSALVGALTGNPALAGAWSAALGPGVKAATSRVPPDLGEVMQGFGVWAATAGGGVTQADLAQIFDSVSKKSDFLQALGGMLGKIRTTAQEKNIFASFADQVRAVVEKGVNAFPSVNLPKVIVEGAKAVAPALVSKEALSIPMPHLVPGTESHDIELSIGVFKLNLREIMAQGLGDEVFYSTRKLASDKPLFDGTYMTLLAQEKKDADYRERVLTANVETFKPAVDPFRGKDPHAAIDRLTFDLSRKYGLR